MASVRHVELRNMNFCQFIYTQSHFQIPEFVINNQIMLFTEVHACRQSDFHISSRPSFWIAVTSYYCIR